MSTFRNIPRCVSCRGDGFPCPSCYQAEVQRLREQVAERTMERDVVGEKLNEYIDKTKCAEEQHGRLVARLSMTNLTEFFRTADSAAWGTNTGLAKALHSYLELTPPAAHLLREEPTP